MPNVTDRSSTLDKWWKGLRLLNSDTAHLIKPVFWKESNDPVTLGIEGLHKRKRQSWSENHLSTVIRLRVCHPHHTGILLKKIKLLVKGGSNFPSNRKQEMAIQQSFHHRIQPHFIPAEGNSQTKLSKSRGSTWLSATSHTSVVGLKLHRSSNHTSPTTHSPLQKKGNTHTHCPSRDIFGN